MDGFPLTPLEPGMVKTLGITLIRGILFRSEYRIDDLQVRSSLKSDDLPDFSGDVSHNTRV
ncbi:MAG: hypothetical protein BWY93_01180 [Euryarchaeota archaeon ADurb.BinA087]|nr:MAG: hypothetical protein BWY93_01180 [Euryarchaeota archaeon ADurb.BinA087]